MLHLWHGVKMRARLEAVLPPPPLLGLQLSGELTPQQALRRALLACYDPRDDDDRLRGAFSEAESKGETVGQAFDQLRKQYPVRREPQSLQVNVPAGSSLLEPLAHAGFRVSVN